MSQKKWDLQRYKDENARLRQQIKWKEEAIDSLQRGREVAIADRDAYRFAWVDHFRLVIKLMTEGNYPKW